MLSLNLEESSLILANRYQSYHLNGGFYMVALTRNEPYCQEIKTRSIKFYPFSSRRVSIISRNLLVLQICVHFFGSLQKLSVRYVYTELFYQGKSGNGT